jgi:hypothetical protein
MVPPLTGTLGNSTEDQPAELTMSAGLRAIGSCF